jgi:signal transduction histidine kinase
MVTSDHELLHTVLRILVENADEYANQESVVTVEVKEIEEYIQIAVKNHGPRIPQEMLGHLFERFYRANQPASSHHSGLGLAIAHLIVGILHGEWSVTSQDEETVFAIKFPKA